MVKIFPFLIFIILNYLLVNILISHSNISNKIENANFKYKNKYKEYTKYKFIYLILDGLRYDLYEELNLYEDLKSNCMEELVETIKKSNMKIKVSNKKNKYGVFSFRTLAGLPTLTTIRLQSLFTGRISQFFDNLHAFTHFKIKNENLFSLLNTAKRTFSFFGDSTIDDIIEINNIKSKKRKFTKPYNPSIIDDIKTIFSSLLSLNKTDIQYIHLNYLDSIGHKKNIFHMKYRHILKIYEKFIRAILYLNIEKNLIIFITSDHGANDDGSHGQGTDKDRDAFSSFIINGKNTIQKGNINQDELIQTIPYLLNCNIPNSSLSNIIHMKELYYDYNKALLENIKRNIYFLKKLNLLGDLLKIKFKSLEEVDKHIRNTIHQHNDEIKINYKIIGIFILLFIYPLFYLKYK